ncbi:MAG: histidine phosphatase family protein [Chloroflexi bacterium]|nr:histidine phosphatase family protein [Chloroflexota bacterium]
MLTRLLLVRHGQTVHNVEMRIAGWTDSPLTSEGERQAERVAAYLARTEQIHALYASPLQRARRTAEAIGRALMIPPAFEDDLRELHFGDCENLTDAELVARYPDLVELARRSADLSFRWPNGESRLEFYTRVRRTMRRIADQHAGQAACVVAHGGVLSSYLADIVLGEPTRWREFLLDNCTVTEVHLNSGAAQLVRCNVDSFHLPPLT